MENSTAVISIIEPVPHQVFQRDEWDQAIIHCKLDLHGVDLAGRSGNVEARIIKGNVAGQWKFIGLVDGDSFSGALNNVPIGEYVFEVRIMSSEAELAICSIAPVFVGDLWILAGQSNMDGVGKLGEKVKGCLWYQGESDTGPETAPLYYERMRAWVLALREDLNDHQFPFIYAQLSVFHILEPDVRWPDSALWNRVQQDQLTLEQAIPFTAMVPTIDAGLVDIIHLDTASLQKVGQRMAWQALRIAYGKQVAETGPRPAQFIWNEERTELKITLSGINGGLKDVDRVYGFKVEKNNLRYGFSAKLTENSQQISFYFEQAIPAESQLSYGAGFNPNTNVMDEKGIPLVVFGPLSV